MERKIIVIVKQLKKQFSVCAFESINSSFQIIFSKVLHHDDKLIFSLEKAFQEIEKITNGKVKNIIYSFNDPETFSIQKCNLNSSLNYESFSTVDVKQLENQFKQNIQNDFLANYYLDNVNVIDKNNNQYKITDLKQLLNKDIKYIQGSVIRYFINNNVYNDAINLCNKLSIKIEKFIVASQLENHFMFSQETNKINASIKITDSNVILTLLKNLNIQDQKILNFGINDLIKLLANELNITYKQSLYLITNYNHLENNLQLPFMFRKEKTLISYNSLIKNFFKNIYNELDMILKVNNIFDNSKVNISFFNNKILNTNTSKKLLLATDNNLNIKTPNNYDFSLLNFDDLVVADYLMKNISDQDITNTFTINTQTITPNIKFKKQTLLKTIIRRIFLM